MRYRPRSRSRRTHRTKRYYANSHRPRRRRIKMPRMNIFFKALIIAIATFALAYYFKEYKFLLWIEAAAWIYLSWTLFKRIFVWANNVSMANDLEFFGLRILGGIVTFVGIYILLATMTASAIVRNSGAESIPIYCLLAGLIILGAFIAFKTNRRHNVVGIWKA